MTTDFTFDDVRPRSWADAFPWLAGASGSMRLGSDGSWWHEAIDETDPATRHIRLGTVSELAMERLTRWTIGQIFPGLSEDIDLLQLNLPARAVNALTRFNCGNSGQLMGITLDEMLDWRNVGVGTVDAILQALADISTSLATPAVANQTQCEEIDSDMSSDNESIDFHDFEWLWSVSDDLTLISKWYVTVGLPAQSLLGMVPPGTPDEVIEARQRLDLLLPSHVLTSADLQLDLAGHFDNALAVLDPRAVEVLRGRLFADNPVSLDQLGQDHGVSRERIRQIEAKSRGAMLTAISEVQPLRLVAESARSLIGTIRPLADLIALIPAMGRTVERVQHPAWRVLDRLDDAYEIEDEWCVVPTMTAARSMTQTQLQESADQYGVVRLDELDLIKTSHPDRLAELTAAWITHCGFLVHGKYALTRTSSVGDYAAAILSIHGSPLSAQEVVDRFAFERSARSTRNALSTDDRFERVDRDLWALKEWGLDAYGGIRSAIRELVTRGGGRAKLDDIVEYITERYSVSGNSVIAYAATAPFATRDGMVQLGNGDRSSRKAPQNTRRLFRRSNGWAYRVRVTTDHLRGSGSAVPMAIATLLDLQYGQSVQLDNPLGPQTVAWTGRQPSIGTIRRFLMDGDVAAGAEIFLILLDDGGFDFERARDPIDNALADALTLVGADPTLDREDARIALARAIALPDDSRVTSIIGEYSSRGDDDVATLLLAVREYLETGDAPTPAGVGADVDEILDLL